MKCLHPHIWRRRVVENPEPGYDYYQCLICDRWKRERPCWIDTGIGHTEGVWLSESADGENWSEPKKVGK